MCGDGDPAVSTLALSLNSAASTTGGRAGKTRAEFPCFCPLFSYSCPLQKEWSHYTKGAGERGSLTI